MQGLILSILFQHIDSCNLHCGNAGEELSIVVRKGKRSTFSKIAEITTSEGSVWQPSQTNFPSLDFLKQPNLAVQVTVAKEHDMNEDAVVPPARVNFWL